MRDLFENTESDVDFTQTVPIKDMHGDVGHANGRRTPMYTYMHIHYTMYTEVASRKSTPKHCIFHLFICSALAFPASNFRAFSLSEAAAYIIQSYVRQKQILPIACTLYIIHCTKQV